MTPEEKMVARVESLQKKLATALVALNDARWFNVIACLTGDECPHKTANECLEAIVEDADKLGDQIQQAIDSAMATPPPQGESNVS